MEVTMIRKASSKNDWYERFNQIQEMFYRKPETEQAVIEKEIMLTNKELAQFESDLLRDSEIVKENCDLMRVDESGVWHCIAVTSKNANYQILVECEGYDYARYTAIVSK